MLVQAWVPVLNSGSLHDAGFFHVVRRAPPVSLAGIGSCIHGCVELQGVSHKKKRLLCMLDDKMCSSAIMTESVRGDVQRKEKN